MTKHPDLIRQPLPGGIQQARPAPDIDLLIGLCRRSCARGHLARAEAHFLQQWLRCNQDLAHRYPAEPIYARLGALLRAQRFNQAEAHDVLRLLVEITGGALKPQLDPDQYAAALPLNDPPPAIEFAGRCFHTLGPFASATRKAVNTTIKSLGGRVQHNVTPTLDYLVIGLIDRRDWQHGPYGVRIWRAVKYRDTHGLPVALVSEEHWLHHLGAACSRVSRHRYRTHNSTR